MSGDRGALIRLTVLGPGPAISLRPRHLVIAGFTGRDEAAVAEHVSELAAIGVPVPPAVPCFYPLDATLLTVAGEVEVSGANTSGEAEPVLIRRGGRWYLAVGSDHTDRDLERSGIAESKAACPKPVSREVAALPGSVDDVDWDGIELSSAVDGRPYQRGTLAALRRPADLLARLAADPGTPATDDGDLVLFCGTLPLLGGEFVAGTAWQLTMRIPGGITLDHRYRARRRPDRLTSRTQQGVASCVPDSST
jgi:4-hydroxyphenylacetate 3-monooxygenase